MPGIPSVLKGSGASVKCPMLFLGFLEKKELKSYSGAEAGRFLGSQLGLRSGQERWTLCWLGLSQLTHARVIREEGASTEKMPHKIRL